jgi:thiamine-monophosphate kinase
MTEFEIIRRFFLPPTTHTVLAGGDDAALIAVGAGMQLAVSTDALVAGRHFFADAEPYCIGYKSMAANLSDMAAMGATPRWVTLSLTLPEADERWLEQFAYGFLDLARDYEVDLIGGDTTRGPLAVCVQMLGEVTPGKALLRSGAKWGDDVWVSGTLGDAALALAHLRGDFELHAQDLGHAVKRLNEPHPRVDLGRCLVGVATSCIDISDGLLADVGHVAHASGLRAVIEWESIPLSVVAARYRKHPLVRQAALAGGDDYELAFTAPSNRRTELIELGGRLSLPLTRVGRMDDGTGVAVSDQAGRPVTLPQQGFDHFR